MGPDFKSTSESSKGSHPFCKCFLASVVEYRSFVINMVPLLQKCPTTNLDSRSALLLQQHVFRFHITMNDFVLVERVQTLQHAVRKFADQLKTEAL